MIFTTNGTDTTHGEGCSISGKGIRPWEDVSALPRNASPVHSFSALPPPWSRPLSSFAFLVDSLYPHGNLKGNFKTCQIMSFPFSKPSKGHPSHLEQNLSFSPWLAGPEPSGCACFSLSLSNHCFICSLHFRYPGSSSNPAKLVLDSGPLRLLLALSATPFPQILLWLASHGLLVTFRESS